MWFDTACDKWVDGTTCEIKLAGREVSWVSNRTGVLCIVQPRTLDLPYKSWSLAPALPAVQDGPSEIEEACAVLSLETPRMTVKIEARGDGSCRLVGPDRPGAQTAHDQQYNSGWQVNSRVIEVRHPPRS